MRKRSTSVKPSPRTAPAGVRPLDQALLGDGRFGVLFALWLVGRSTVAAIDARIDGTGLTAEEFPVYCVLDIAGPLTPSALGTWMAAPPTTVSAFVKRMERRGHVARRANPADGRSHLLELTDAGRAAQRRASDAFRPLSDQVHGDLGERADGLRVELARLRGILDSARSDSGDR